MASMQDKILALCAGDVVRVESESYGTIEFTIEGTTDNRSSPVEGMRAFQAWGNFGELFILLEAGPDAWEVFIPTSLEVVV